jgi:hypothetical protein
MNRFKIICPECGAIILTLHPVAIVWERCPGCKRHVWDKYDVLMADISSYEPERTADFSRPVHVQADN